MKIGILTFHRADNYGAMLQALALMDAIKQMGHEITIIDYRASAIENFYKFRFLPHFHYNPFNFVREMFYNLKWTPIFRRKALHCNKFREKYYVMSTAVTSEDERKKIENEYDLIFTGSDQIWRSSITHGKDDWYAFKRNFNSSVVASYAASAGCLEVFRKFFFLYKEDLERYDFISVREENLQKFLLQRLPKKSIQTVVDPTLLVEQNYWYEITSTQSPISNPYILYYDVDFNDIANTIVGKVATERALDVAYFKKVRKGKFKAINVADSDPVAFLNLIRNSEYVITSSFHATVFSIVFKKKFITVLHPRTGDRVKSLLKSIGLQDRLIEKGTDFDINNMDKEIDWIKVFELLEEQRSRSLSFIRKCIIAANNLKEINNE